MIPLARRFSIRRHDVVLVEALHEPGKLDLVKVIESRDTRSYFIARPFCEKRQQFRGSRTINRKRLVKIFK